VPFGLFDLEDRGPTTQIALAVGALGVLWVAMSMGALDPLIAFVGANAQLVVPLAIIAAVGAFAIDAADENDDAADVVRKTGERTGEASNRALTVGVAGVGGLIAVVTGLANPLIAALGGAVSWVGEMPMLASNITALGLGIAGAAGVLNARVLAAVGFLVLLLAMAWREQ